MNYKAGDIVVNGIGREVEIKKFCLTCKTLTGKEGHKTAKCYTHNCPAFTGKPWPRRRKEKEYFVFFLTETDGECMARRLGAQSTREFVEKHGQEDVAIVEGNIIKNFDTKIDLSKL